MKLKISHYLFASIFALASCNSEDDTTANSEEEKQYLSSWEVLDNLIIENATKKSGAPSTPNEAITFELLKDSKSAIQS